MLWPSEFFPKTKYLGFSFFRARGEGGSGPILYGPHSRPSLGPFTRIVTALLFELGFLGVSSSWQRSPFPGAPCPSPSPRGIAPSPRGIAEFPRVSPRCLGEFCNPLATLSPFREYPGAVRCCPWELRAAPGNSVLLWGTLCCTYYFYTSKLNCLGDQRSN